MRYLLVIFLLYLPMASAAGLYVTIVEGLGGTEEFTGLFDDQVERLQQAAERYAGKDQVVTLAGDNAERQHILAHFSELNRRLGKEDRTAVFLVGHGSYDGHEYKFNIPGPDLSMQDLHTMMDDNPAGFQVLVNTSSASGAILDELKKDSRIVITATRSGNERNAPRFGNFFVDALYSYSADLNKNETISIEEAFQFAQRETEEFYKSEGRLATEHPQLQGDKAGQFNIARLAEARPAEKDPQLERLQVQKRNIDRLIENLQLRKTEMNNEDYLEQLQQLILELSLTEDMIEDLQQPQDTDDTR